MTNPQTAPEGQNPERIHTSVAKRFSVLDAIPGDVCVTREDRIVVFMNKSLVDKMGDLTGRKCFETDLATADVCKSCPITRGWDDNNFPFTRRAWTSEKELHEITVSKIIDEETGTAYFISIEHDVTAETEKEQKIQSLMASMDQMSEAVAVVDTNGRGLYANKAFLRLTGLEQGHVVGFPMMDLTATSDHNRPMSEVLKEAMQRGWHGDASFLRKDGSKHLVSVEATPVKDTDGAPLGVVAIFRDVTRDRSEKVEFEKYKTQLEERMEQRTTELAKRVSQLTTINKISRVVTSLLDPDELMSEFVKSIAQGFEFDHVVIMLLDKDRGELYFKTGVGVDQESAPDSRRQKLKEGIVGHAAYFSETLVTGDVQSDPRYTGNRPAGTQSELAVPIMFRGEVLGVLDIQSNRRDAFTRNDVPIIEMVADILATALTNARTYSESKEREYALSVLDRISKQVSFRLESNVVLDQVARDAAGLLKGEKVLVGRKDDARNVIVWVASYNVDLDSLGGVEFDAGLGVTGRAIRRLKTEIVNDYLSDPDADPDDAKLLNIRSIISAPLMIEGRGIGVINVFNKLDMKPFTKSDALFLSSLADHAAIALENADLLSSLNKRVRSQLALLETALSMQKQIDSAGIYEYIAEKIREVTYYDAITFYRVDHEHNLVIPAAVKGSCAEEVMQEVFPIGEGITGYVAKTGVAEMVNEALDDDRAVQVPGTPSDKEALMAIPLKGRERVIGVLSLYRDGGRKFTSDDFEIAQLFASQAAVAVENSELYRAEETLLRDSRKKVEQMASVLELTTSAMYMDDIDILLQRIVDSVVAFFDFKRSSISLLDVQKNVFVNHALAGFPDWVVSGTVTPAESLLADMKDENRVGESGYYSRFETQDYGIEEFEFLAHPELASKPRVGPDAWHERDILVFALRDRKGMLRGYLLVDEPNDLKAPRKEQIETLEILAGIASIAVENSSLYERQVFAVNEIALLNDLMTHDINNFNQGIMGYIELLLQDKALEENQKRYAEKALLQVRNNARLIDNIRKLSKVRAMSAKEFAPLDVYPPLVAAIETVTKAQSERSVVINSSVLPKCHYIMGNQFIGDLFLNIVSNAVKFDTAKRVKVDIGITEDRSAKGDYWLISIVDRGRGIPDDRKKAVFERFATGMTGIKGFGLGLSIVSTIVEKFGGRIWVEDRIQGDFSKGAVFKVLLPKARPPPEPLPALSLPMAPVAVPGNNGVKP